MDNDHLARRRHERALHTIPIGRPCKVCQSPHRGRIELGCAEGREFASVAREFGVSKHSVNRHWRGHVGNARKASLIASPALDIDQLAKRAAQEERSVIEYLAILRSELFHLYTEARDRGLILDACSVAQRLINVLDSLGRHTGQLRQAAGITINNVNGSVSAGPAIILNDPSVIKLQSTIIRALGPYPEARAAVVAALRDLELQSIPKGMNGSHVPSLALAGPPTIEASANA